jgi:ribonuclease D
VQWSLSSLALELTGKQVEKNKSKRCGDWETLPLSDAQLLYAAIDAVASLHLFQILASLPDPLHKDNQDGGDDLKRDPEHPAT